MFSFTYTFILYPLWYFVNPLLNLALNIRRYVQLKSIICSNLFPIFFAFSALVVKTDYLYPYMYIRNVKKRRELLPLFYIVRNFETLPYCAIVLFCFASISCDSSFPSATLLSAFSIAFCSPINTKLAAMIVSEKKTIGTSAIHG